MIISKSDLYKNEWLDLVFAKRNKSYGAYDLRQHNVGTINKAMLITFSTVTALLFGLGYVVKAKTTEAFHRVDVEIKTVVVPPPPKDEKIHEMKQKTTAPKQTVSTTQFLPPKATSDPVTEEPAKISEMKDPGRETVDIQEGGQITIAEPFMKKDGSGVAAVTEDTGIHEVGSIDIEPEPVGGMAAWNKFLQKNMRYPTQAADAGKSGKVYLSFVVEKDGSITDVKVVRSPGFGMDDEATRVLKLAPLWKPGVQHGQKVRVRYMLPFNFQLDQ